MDLRKTFDSFNYKTLCSSWLNAGITNQLNFVPVTESYEIFSFRSDWLSVVDSYVYADPSDHFERPPFVVHFQSSKAGTEIMFRNASLSDSKKQFKFACPRDVI